MEHQTVPHPKSRIIFLTSIGKTCKELVRQKRPSLFICIIGDEEKSFIRCQAFKLFYSSLMKRPSKLGCLLLTYPS
jgi:hypothetical protein